MYTKADQLTHNKEEKGKYRRKCKTCREWFRTDRKFQVVCGSVDCALEYGKVQVKKQQRASKIAFKQSDKSKLKEKAQAVFNRYIRLRDKDLPCISCGHIGNRKINAGHFKSAGQNPQIRFNMLNVHKQCEQCNSYLAGNLIPYKANLIKKIGIARVEALESDKSTKKYSVEYLQKLIRVFNKKIKRISK